MIIHFARPKSAYEGTPRAVRPARRSLRENRAGGTNREHVARKLCSSLGLNAFIVDAPREKIRALLVATAAPLSPRASRRCAIQREREREDGRRGGGEQGGCVGGFVESGRTGRRGFHQPYLTVLRHTSILQGFPRRQPAPRGYAASRSRSPGNKFHIFIRVTTR